MTTEALLRQENCVMSFKQLHSISVLIEQLLHEVTPSSLPACVSLMSSVRKHTAMSLKKLAQQQGLQSEGEEAKAGWRKDSGKESDGFHTSLHQMLHALVICRDCEGELCSRPDDGGSGISSN